MKALVVGNCQLPSFVACARQLLPDADILGCFAALTDSQLTEDIKHRLENADTIFLQHGVNLRAGFIQEALTKAAPRIHLWPHIRFTGYHPDAIYIRGQADLAIRSPLGGFQNSLLCAGAYLAGLSAADAGGVFNAYYFSRAGFFEAYDLAAAAFTVYCRSLGLDVQDVMANRDRSQGFMYTQNHPTIEFIGEIASLVCRQAGLSPAADVDFTGLKDDLKDGPIWPVYPELAAHLGVAGSTTFRTGLRYLHPLLRFVELSYEIFRTDESPLATDDRVARMARILGSG